MIKDKEPATVTGGRFHNALGGPLYDYYWRGWTGNNGDLKLGNAGEHYTQHELGNYAQLAQLYSENRAEERAHTLAGALEFTLNVIPFGAGALKIADHEGDWTGWDIAEAGVMFATDTVAVVIPLAKGVQASKWFANAARTQKVAKAVAENARAAGWAAGGLEAVIAGSHVAEDIQKNGKMTWASSGEIIGIMLNLGIIRLARKSPTGETKSPGTIHSGKDVLGQSADIPAANKQGTKLNKLDAGKLEADATHAASTARQRTANLTPPQDFISVQAYGTPPNVQYRLVDASGTPIAPNVNYNNIGDAQKAAKAAVSASYAPDRATRMSQFAKEPKNLAVAEYLEDHGRVVTKNPFEHVSGFGRQGDAFVDGVKHEFKSPKPGATANTIKDEINKSIRRQAQAREIVIDARGTGLLEDAAKEGTSKGLKYSRDKLDGVTVIGDGYFFRLTPRSR